MGHTTSTTNAVASETTPSLTMTTQPPGPTGTSTTVTMATGKTTEGPVMTSTGQTATTGFTVAGTTQLSPTTGQFGTQTTQKSSEVTTATTAKSVVTSFETYPTVSTVTAPSTPQVSTTQQTERTQASNGETTSAKVTAPRSTTSAGGTTTSTTVVGTSTTQTTTSHGVTEATLKPTESTTTSGVVGTTSETTGITTTAGVTEAASKTTGAATTRGVAEFTTMGVATTGTGATSKTTQTATTKGITETPSGTMGTTTIGGVTTEITTQMTGVTEMPSTSTGVVTTKGVTETSSKTTGVYPTTGAMETTFKTTGITTTGGVTETTPITTGLATTMGVTEASSTTTGISTTLGVSGTTSMQEATTTTAPVTTSAPSPTTPTIVDETTTSTVQTAGTTSTTRGATTRTTSKTAGRTTSFTTNQQTTGTTVGTTAGTTVKTTGTTMEVTGATTETTIGKTTTQTTSGMTTPWTVIGTTGKTTTATTGSTAAETTTGTTIGTVGRTTIGTVIGTTGHTAATGTTTGITGTTTETTPGTTIDIMGKTTIGTVVGTSGKTTAATTAGTTTETTGRTTEKTSGTTVATMGKTTIGTVVGTSGKTTTATTTGTTTGRTTETTSGTTIGTMGKTTIGTVVGTSGQTTIATTGTTTETTGSTTTGTTIATMGRTTIGTVVGTSGETTTSTTTGTTTVMTGRTTTETTIGTMGKTTPVTIITTGKTTTETTIPTTSSASTETTSQVTTGTIAEKTAKTSIKPTTPGVIPETTAPTSTETTPKTTTETTAHPTSEATTIGTATETTFPIEMATTTGTTIETTAKPTTKVTTLGTTTKTTVPSTTGITTSEKTTLATTTVMTAPTTSTATTTLGTTTETTVPTTSAGTTTTGVTTAEVPTETIPTIATTTSQTTTSTTAKEETTIISSVGTTSRTTATATAPTTPAATTTQETEKITTVTTKTTSTVPTTTETTVSPTVTTFKGSTVEIIPSTVSTTQGRTTIETSTSAPSTVETLGTTLPGPATTEKITTIKTSVPRTTPGPLSTTAETATTVFPVFTRETTTTGAVSTQEVTSPGSATTTQHLTTGLTLTTPLETVTSPIVETTTGSATTLTTESRKTTSVPTTVPITTSTTMSTAAATTKTSAATTKAPFTTKAVMSTTIPGTVTTTRVPATTGPSVFTTAQGVLTTPTMVVSTAPTTSVPYATSTVAVTIIKGATPPPCYAYSFVCDNGNCVHGSDVCNGVNDCGDGSDESQCGTTILSPTGSPSPRFTSAYTTTPYVATTTTAYVASTAATPNCTDMQFHCTSGECIFYSQVCDGTPDCVDGSDEINCIDCIVSQWTMWESCSRTCGVGVAKRTRTVLQEAGDGGLPCEGPYMESQTCFVESCPVDGNWSPWSLWTTCDVTCGGGTRFRYRSCSNPPPKNNGQYCEGSSGEMEYCNETPCPEGCPEGRIEVTKEECLNEEFHPCPQTCADLSEQISCTTTCDEGCYCPPNTYLQNATCVAIEKCHCTYNGIEYTPGQKISVDNCTDCECINGEMVCTEHPCPVHCGWSSWTAWTPCDQTCGTGLHERFRSPNNPPASNGGQLCVGFSRQVETCVLTQCPVITPEWSSWSSWSNCTSPCGPGEIVRTRYCYVTLEGGVILPTGGCPGSDTETKACNLKDCEEECDDTKVHLMCGECPHSCLDLQDGVACTIGDCVPGCYCPPGMVLQDGMCVTPVECRCRLIDVTDTGETVVKEVPPGTVIQRGCNNCTCLDARIECPDIPCQVDGDWSPWSSWSHCSATCVGNDGVVGQQVRYRSCNDPAPAYGGQECEGEYMQSLDCHADRCPIDGNWSPWTTWTECSQSCVGGSRYRQRTCDSPTPGYGGSDCTGPPAESQECGAPCEECPPGMEYVGEESCGTTCPRTCAELSSQVMCTSECLEGCRCPHGKLLQDEVCVDPAECRCYYEGQEYDIGAVIRVEPCQNCTCIQGNMVCSQDPCPVDCGWTLWSSWGNCTKPCDGGTKRRYRSGSNPPPHDGGKPSPIGGWSHWTPWSDCSVTCSNGTQYRYRTCSNPPPPEGCLGDAEEHTSCDAGPCIYDGNWSPWSPWTSCSKTCDMGFTARHRECNNPPPSNGGAYCVGLGSEAKTCTLEECPIPQCENITGSFFDECGPSCPRSCEDIEHCYWSCEPGCYCPEGLVLNENRTACVQPAECYCLDVETDQRYPPGATIQKNCNECVCQNGRFECTDEPCPIDGDWCPWTNWMGCTRTCGFSMQHRYRTCSCPEPAHGGAMCQGTQTTAMRIGIQKEMSSCDVPTLCPTDGHWSPWSTWSGCQECVPGSETRTRTCTNPPPENNGQPCQGTSTQSRTCHLDPVECGPECVEGFVMACRLGPRSCIDIWEGTEYVENTAECQYECGCPDDTVLNNGTCTSISQCPCRFDVNDYPGVTEVLLLAEGGQYGYLTPGQVIAVDCNQCVCVNGGLDCTDHQCTTDGEWSTWSPWSNCTVTCGGGVQYRYRSCDNPPPSYGGLACTGMGEEAVHCNTQECPIHGNVGEWSQWTSCSASCGVGSRTRHRYCNDPEPLHGGMYCVESLVETSDCNLGDCPDKTCVGGKVYQTCPQQCPRTCGDLQDGVTCETTACVPDCGCPEGQVDLGGVCVLLSDCPCRWNLASDSDGNPIYGEQFDSGEVVSYKCTNCTCLEGRFICNEELLVVPNWSAWSSWTTCTASCGGGTQYRSRTCDNPPPVCQDLNCIGHDEETRSCNTQQCETGCPPGKQLQPCGNTCPHTCAERTADIACVEPYCTQGCFCPPGMVEDDAGNCVQYCPCTFTVTGLGAEGEVIGQLLDGSPVYHGQEVGSGDVVQVNCNTCTCTDGHLTCTDEPCPVDGGVSSWTVWTNCSMTCGGVGVQVRTRTCNSPAPAHGGQPCTETLFDTKYCHTPECPVPGGWSAWTSWSYCTVTCGGGVSHRTRTCSNPPPAHFGPDCEGHNTETIECSPEPCELGCEGGKEYTEYCTRCPRTCNELAGRSECAAMETCQLGCRCPNGTYEQDGYCILAENCKCEIPEEILARATVAPLTMASTFDSLTFSDAEPLSDRTTLFPQEVIVGECMVCICSHGLLNCTEDEMCAAPPSWSSWSSWTPCSRPCITGVKDMGSSIKSRRRYCNNPPPRPGGEYCEGDDIQEVTCNVPQCPQPGGWSTWSPWSPCSATCGSGTQVRTRTCDNPPPDVPSLTCPGASLQTQACFAEEDCTSCLPNMVYHSCLPCPRTCLDLQEHVECVERDCIPGCSCPEGLLIDGDLCVEREACPCVMVNPFIKADRPVQYPAGSLVTISCNNCTCEHGRFRCTDQICDVDCTWNPWSHWTSCTKSCGVGIRTRQRTYQEPHGNGVKCRDMSYNTETEACNTDACSVDGEWSTWSHWTECDATCGGGTTRRSRTCSAPAPKNGGLGCEGLGQELSVCNAEPCGPECPEGQVPDLCVNECGYRCEDFHQVEVCVEEDDCIPGCRCPNGLLLQHGECVPPPLCECVDYNGNIVAPGSVVQNDCNNCTCKAGVFSCTDQPCPVTCGWSTWSTWTDCSTTCGQGTQNRFRSPNNPPASNGGKECTGEHVQSQVCQLDTCTPVCTYDGVEYQVGDTLYTAECTECTCTPNGLSCININCSALASWEPWGTWSACDATCGGGKQTRTRTCTARTHCCDYACPGLSLEQQPCNIQDCPTTSPSCQVHTEVRNLTHNSCVADNVQVSFCTGKCPSYTQINVMQPYYQTVCECCTFTLDALQPVRFVELDCGNGEKETTVLPRIERCDCIACAGT
ncbi:SCO-spondin-like [Branchiostoma floridae]|uniref:SCO-spondin-like n=2 Tax=Branchiostoma floridae TaxID=7739 RepID=A0A9J7HUU0_BRAFL|nr:SCO-spondin-like [Branchiostoma floridae]